MGKVFPGHYIIYNADDNHVILPDLDVNGVG